MSRTALIVVALAALAAVPEGRCQTVSAPANNWKFIELAGEILAARDAPTNDQPRIQAALNRVDAAGGGRVFLGPGQYFIGPSDGAVPGSAGEHSLQLGDNTTLEMADGCVLVKKCAGGNSTPVIRNKDWIAGNSNVRVVGGEVGAQNAANIGRLIVFVQVSGLSIEKVKMREVHGDWSVTVNDSNDVHVADLDVDGGDAAGEDGLHFAGCQRVIVRNCNVKSGDDVIALHNEASTTEEMSDVLIENVYGECAVGNIVRITVDFGITHPIRRVTIRNVTGNPGSGGLRVDEMNDAFRISDVDVSGMFLDCTGSLSGQAFFTRGSQRVTLNTVAIIAPALAPGIDGGDSITLNNFSVIDPSTAINSTQRCLSIANTRATSNVRVIGGTFSGAHTYGIHVGGASPGHCTGFEINGTRIVGAGINGVRVINGSRGLIAGNRVSGSGTGYGILEESGQTPGPSANSFDHNDCFSNGVNGAIPTVGAGSHVGMSNQLGAQQVSLILQAPLTLQSATVDPGTPLDGTIYYDSDDDKFRARINGAWADLDTGGGAGDVATDPLWDAPGDLAVGTGANTAARLPMGTALQTLRVNAGATALEWAAAAGGGSGTLTTIKEDDVGVGGADIVTLDFLGADFDLAETPDTEVQLVIAAAIARDAEVAAAYQPLDADLTDLADGTLTGSKVSGAVVVSGGTVDNSVIGGATPAAGTFTTLTSQGAIKANGADGDGLQLFDTESVGYGSVFLFDGTYTFRNSSAAAAAISAGSLTLAAGTNGVALTTSQSLTGANASSLLGLATTWNTTGNPSAIKLNVTNTASGATSKLLDLQTASTTRFSVSNLGVVTCSPTSGSEVFLAGTGSNYSVFGPVIRSDGQVAWSSTTAYSGTQDLLLKRDAAGILAQRNTTNAQVSRVYRTFTDVSNYERLALQTGAGYVELAAETAGTGTDDVGIRLTPAGTGAVSIGGSNVLVASAIGATVQAWDALLDGIAALTDPGANKVVGWNDTTNQIEWQDNAGGTDDQTAAEVPFTPAGGVAATNAQAAIEEVDAEKQPLDSDLTSIAALTTTAHGRGLLDDADPAASRDALGATSGVFPGSVVADATASADGVVELADATETSAGTDATRAVTPDALGGSVYGTKIIELICFDFTVDAATGDGKFYFHVPASLNGFNLVTVHSAVITAGTTGTTDVQIARIRGGTPADVLSTKLTIDSTETGSDTAAVAAVIDAANDDLATNDRLRIDVDAVSTTAPKGLLVTIEARKP